MTNGFSYCYHLDVSTFILRGFKSDFFFISFSDEIKIANRIAPDGTPRFAASHLGLFFFCLCPIKRTSGVYGLMLHDCIINCIIFL